MPHYIRIGRTPAKHHIRFPRGNAESYKGEGLHYEHIVTTEGFDRAYSILYHLKPPTRVKRVELLREWALKAAAPSPLRHHHLKSAGIPRSGDPYTGRVPLMAAAVDTVRKFAARWPLPGIGMKLLKSSLISSMRPLPFRSSHSHSPPSG